LPLDRGVAGGGAANAHRAPGHSPRRPPPPGVGYDDAIMDDVIDPAPGAGAQAGRRAQLAEQQAARESARAQRLVDEFVTRARAAALPVVDLRARTWDGHVVKTNARGWYLRNDHTVAIGEDGGYYQLTVPGGWAARLRGVRVTPVPPPLVVGRGGRDGESGDLKDFLARALAGQVA